MTNESNQNIYCCYCGEVISVWWNLTKEHLVPRSLGGNSLPINKRDCCAPCNRDRGNKPLRSWLYEIEQDLANPKLNSFKRRRYDALSENIKYWIVYVESAGAKLYHSPELFVKANP